MLLIAFKVTAGWLLRIAGEIVWIIVGFMLSMSAIWFWCMIFLCVDTYGYYAWKKKQRKQHDTL